MYGKSSTLVLNYYKPTLLGGLSNFLSKAVRSLNGLTTRFLESSPLTFAALPFLSSLKLLIKPPSYAG